MNNVKTSFCRDCLKDFRCSRKRCDYCRSPRIVYHKELEDLSIVHIDCDSFYAAVEKRDNPELSNVPVIVGGSKRGVVSTCCYIARKYGVESAMPIFKAQKLCPKAVFISPRHDRYREVSRNLRSYLEKLTPKIEFVSIDEGYLDLTGTRRLHGLYPAKLVAKAVQEIEINFGITVSIGLSYNKMLAKIASTKSKPRGFSIVGKGDTDEFLTKLTVREINGIGKKLSEKLNKAGIFCLGDIQTKDKRDLVIQFGDTIRLLFNLIESREKSSVNAKNESKSISTEQTFAQSLKRKSEIKKFLWAASVKVSDAAKKQNVVTQSVHIKLKKENFKTLTRSLTLNSGTNLASEIYNAGLVLLEKEISHAPFRLIGIGIGKIEEINGTLHSNDFFKNQEKDLEDATDKIRNKYGSDSIFPGIMIDE